MSSVHRRQKVYAAATCSPGFATRPLARNSSISVALNHGCRRTSSLYSPSSGACRHFGHAMHLHPAGPWSEPELLDAVAHGKLALCVLDLGAHVGLQIAQLVGVATRASDNLFEALDRVVR